MAAAVRRRGQRETRSTLRSNSKAVHSATMLSAERGASDAQSGSDCGGGCGNDGGRARAPNDAPPRATTTADGKVEWVILLVEIWNVINWAGER